MDIFDKNTELLSKVLDLTSVKSKVIANNIANANTPGFKRLEVTFQKELRKAIESGNSLDKIRNVQEKIEFSKNVNGNKDSVDIDKEMVEFFKNSDKHNINLEIISKRFKFLISAIQGR